MPAHSRCDQDSWSSPDYINRVLKEQKSSNAKITIASCWHYPSHCFEAPKCHRAEGGGCSPAPAPDVTPASQDKCRSREAGVPVRLHRRVPHPLLALALRASWVSGNSLQIFTPFSVPSVPPFQVSPRLCFHCSFPSVSSEELRISSLLLTCLFLPWPTQKYW